MNTVTPDDDDDDQGNDDDDINQIRIIIIIIKPCLGGNYVDLDDDDYHTVSLNAQKYTLGGGVIMG